MELTVLGKYGPYPKAGGACSGYLVQNEGEYLLLDMGAGTLSRLAEIIDIKALRHIFVSHLHFDHTSDLLVFRYLLEDINHTVNIYTKYQDSEWYKLLFSHPKFKVINIDENSEIYIGSMTLRFYQMVHTAEDYAVIIHGGKTLCYTGDTRYNESLEKCFKISDYVLADCSKPTGFNAPHMTVDDAKILAEKYSAKIIATHQSADYSPSEAFKNYPSILSAEEMKTYRL